MLVADIAGRLSRERKLLDAVFATPQEIQRHQKALSYLLNAWWPDEYINGKMIKRAEQGLVPEYYGEESWMEYKVRWAEEDGN